MFYYHRTLQSNASAKAISKASVHATGSTSKDYFL